MSHISEVKHQILLTEWAERIHNCQTSGMKVPEWCSQNGVNIKTYYYWLKRVREKALACIPSLPTAASDNAKLSTSGERISFKSLEVQVPISSFQAAVIVRLPNVTLEVANGATQHTVEAVLLALKSTC